MQKAKEFDLNQNIFRLLKNETFFAVVSRSVTKIRDTSIPTAGVCLNPHNFFFELHFNPFFLENLGKTDVNGEPLTDPLEIFERKEIEILGILKHEFYHLIFNHLTERFPQECKIPELRLIWNIAADLAINSHIFNELPFCACVPGRVYKDPVSGKISEQFKNFPLYLSAERYFSMLKADPKIKELLEILKHQFDDENQENKNGNPKSFDDHSMWNNEQNKIEDNDAMKKIAKNRLQKTIQDACNSAIGNGNDWGSVSKEAQAEILKSISPKVDWKAILRYFIKTSQNAFKTSSIKKINKRYPYVHPGKKNSRTANVAVSIDQSGSVSDKMLDLFFSELNKLSELVTFTVIPFDCQVYKEKVYIWRKKEKHPTTRELSGGTDFDAPTDFVNSGNFDGHIILTDLQAPKPGKSKVQRIWLTTELCAQRSPFRTQEKIIFIPESELEI